MTGESVRANVRTNDAGPTSIRDAMERQDVTSGSVRDLLDAISGGALLWRGFEHEWGYNHRLNRLGSYVEPHVDGDWTVGHTAASGSGEDDVEYRDYYTDLDAVGVGFEAGFEQLTIESTEGETYQIEDETVRVPLSGPVADRDAYTVVLNGFDLYSNKDADKLKSFMLTATQPEVVDGGDALEFDVRGFLNVDCDSLECDGYPSTAEVIAAAANPVIAAGVTVKTIAQKLNQTTSYELAVNYLVVGGDEDAVSITRTGQIEADYEWEGFGFVDFGDPEPELSGEITTASIPAPRPPDDVANAVGFNTLSVVVDHEMHLLTLNMAIEDVRPAGADVEVDLDLLFKNWTRGMPLAAKAEEGSATLGAGLTLLQFEDAERHQRGDRQGSAHWDGGNKDADHRDARHERTVDR